MSGILRRTAFYDQLNDCIRPFDWAMVTTGIGTMLEPYNPFMRKGVGSPAAATEFDDQINMVNELQGMNSLKEKQLMGDTVHGGNLWPRVGR